MHLKLYLVGPPERCVYHKVDRGQLDQHWDPVVRDLSFRHPDIFRPLLVFASCDAEEGVEDGNESIPVDRDEDESVNPFGVTPFKSPKEIVGSLPGLGPCADGKVDAGPRRATRNLERLVVARTRYPLLWQRGEESEWGTSLV